MSCYKKRQERKKKNPESGYKSFPASADLVQTMYLIKGRNNLSCVFKKFVAYSGGLHLQNDFT